MNVSEFADLIVINKKDLVPVSASEMQNKYFQESVKSTQSIIKKNIHKNKYNENIHPNHLKRIRMEF
ncbi:hypothetical protein HpCK101_33420 [Helicobacter pylori]